MSEQANNQINEEAKIIKARLFGGKLYGHEIDEHSDPDALIVAAYNLGAKLGMKSAGKDIDFLFSVLGGSNG